MKRVILVHGFMGSPDENWFPWLKNQLVEQGISVIVPAMPNPNLPRYKKWLEFLKEQVGEVDSDTFFVGHSLGCPTILRLLEGLPAGQKASGAVLVSGFAEPIRLINLNGFTAGSWDDEKIRQSVGEIVLINSDNDEHVPLQMAERMRDRFGAKLIVLHDAGHITAKSGHLTVPELKDELMRLMS